MLIVLASGKGGTGKSTSAIALAAALRERGFDPRLVDRDSGADSTWSLGFEPAPAAVDVIRGRTTVAEAAVTSAEGIRILAGGPGLIRLEERPVNDLAKRLREIANDELVIIDTPPGFAPIVTRAAISAAHVVVVPFVPEPTPERRARDVLDIAEILEVEPVILGLAVMVDNRRALTASVLADAAEGGLAPIALIPRTVVVPESANAARSIIAHAPRSAAAEAYRAAARRIGKELRRVERSNSKDGK